MSSCVKYTPHVTFQSLHYALHLLAAASGVPLYPTLNSSLLVDHSLSVVSRSKPKATYTCHMNAGYTSVKGRGEQGRG